MPIPMEDPDYIPPKEPSLYQRTRQTANEDIRRATRSSPLRFWLASAVAFSAMAFVAQDLTQMVAYLLTWISGGVMGALATRVS